MILPSGIVEKDVVEAVIASGYPLQSVVAVALADEFQVIQEWGYMDETFHEQRTLDVFATRALQPSSPMLQPQLTLLIECKRSTLPFVAFASPIPQVPRGFPSIVGFSKNEFELHAPTLAYRRVGPAEFLACRELEFVGTGPTTVSSLGRLERKGKKLELSGSVPYRNLVLPLARALDHYERTWRGLGRQPAYYPNVVLCIGVVDASLLVVRGSPEVPELHGEPWVRVVRQEAVEAREGWRRRYYVVDLIHRTFFGDYVSRHALPFAKELAGRMIEKENIIMAGRGSVRDHDDWQWAALQGVSR
jgi:hypothetical protein